MSNLQNGIDAIEHVLHNVYFEGKVQSLGLETDKGRATVGVMKKGTYQFSTSSMENIVVIAGTMNTKIDGKEWVAHYQHESFEIDKNVVFDVFSDMDVAYICYYKD
jgi:uncharacterized protein YaiE (UPF0345 family)